MPFMTWTNEMSVGVKVLDDDHKKMVGYINDLHDGIVAGHTRQVLVGVLDHLTEYTQTHFAREEAFFAQSGYPAADRHKLEHESMVKHLQSVQARFESSSVIKLDLELMSFLQSWLAHHIQGMDKMYGPHLNAKGIF